MATSEHRPIGYNPAFPGIGSANLMTWQSTLHEKTHRPDFLWTTSIAILAAGLILGGIVSFFPRTFVSNDDSIWSAMFVGTTVSMQPDTIGKLVDENVPFEFQLVALARVASVRKDRDELQPGLDKIPESRRAIATELIDSVLRGEPTSKLSSMVNEKPPALMAHHALGAYHWTRQRYGLAATQFEAEGTRDDAALSRRYAFDAYQMAEDAGALERLQNDPQYQIPVSARDRLVIAQAKRDYLAIVKISFELLFTELVVGWSAVLAAIAGLGWFAVVMQMGQVGQPHGPRLWLSLVAIVMGGLSIGATYCLIAWQEMDWNLHDSAEGIEGIRFFILGVGLREEAAKLLMLLPLMPWIVRRRSEMEALIVSACVGLGFAIVENVNYFDSTIGTGSVGRFMTANFLHMAMTGLIGLAVARAFWSRDAIGQSLLTFLMVVVVHGLYDATIVVDVFEPMRIVSLIIFVLLSYAFFQELRRQYRSKREIVSLAATFLWTLTTLTAITFIYVSWQIGFQAAGQSLSQGIAGVGVLIVMYLREIPNSLVQRS